MNTMNNCYHNIEQKQHVFSITLKIIHKVLVVISVYLVFGLVFQSVYANVNETADPYQSQHGSVWLLPDNGVYIEALQMQTDVDYVVTGSIARARVKQQFKNTSSLWAEGIYVFPLPEKAAVDHFRMIIGERIIEGQVKERVTAKKIYQQAKTAGKKASLIEQQRPNVFTTALANIAPGEEISVEFEFQQVLDYSDKAYRLRFPMVVGPRYHPSQNSAATVSLQDPESPDDDNTSVYTETGPVNHDNQPIRIHVLLDAGASLYDLSSAYHDIDIKQTSETRYSIATTGESIPADRDFELLWKPQLNNRPQLSAFNETIDEDNGGSSSYTLLTLLPPDLSHLQQRVQARDVVFVIDVSGSMAGTSIEQAKASLITALDGLSSIDRFNIIWFNDDTGSLFPKTITASSEYIRYAKQFISRLSADGGTEMMPAMQLALSDQESFSRFRQVIFITDGNISNEVELFSLIEKQLGNSRLFTIGIGSAPNTYFMRKAAQKGRGTFTYIGDINEVHDKTTSLFRKLEAPALTNIQVEISTGDETDEYEIFPRIVPDLYAGETATLVIRGNDLPENIVIRGDYGSTEWQHNAELKSASQAASGGGIRVAWAREKIATLMDRLHDASNTADTAEQRQSIKQQVIDTALQHHLVSRYTSMVAVDVTPVNTDGMLYRERLKNNLPHGWKNTSAANGIMLAQASTGSMLNLLLAILCFVGALLMRQLFSRGVTSSKRPVFAE